MSGLEPHCFSWEFLTIIPKMKIFLTLKLLCQWTHCKCMNKVDASKLWNFRDVYGVDFYLINLLVIVIAKSSYVYFSWWDCFSCLLQWHKSLLNITFSALLLVLTSDIGVCSLMPHLSSEHGSINFFQTLKSHIMVNFLNNRTSSQA